jgi:L-aspartate semialdehyde sulfurtransferase ferredoxin
VNRASFVADRPACAFLPAIAFEGFIPMPTTTRKCWLTFEGGKQNEPCLWMMAHKYPEVRFDIRQANVTKDIGIMAVLFSGEEDEVEDALKYLAELGVKVDPVEGGSLVAG